MYVSKLIKLNIPRECILLYMNCAPINLDLKKAQTTKGKMPKVVTSDLVCSGPESLSPGVTARRGGNGKAGCISAKAGSGSDWRGSKRERRSCVQ